jgi:hypothetical protein
MALVPSSGEEEAEEPDADATPWGFAVDRLELAGGRLRFRDYALRELETIEIGLPTLVVRDVALAPGHYRGPARTGVDVRVDEGRLRASTRLWLRDDGLAMATTLRARRLPLRRMRLYVPDVGWRELEGELGASVVHRLDTGRVHRVHGTATLDGVEVHVPDVPEPALTWKHLAIALASLDLNARRAVVDDVTLAGATLIVRPRDPAPLPVLSAGGAAAAATSPQQPPAAEPATPPAAPDEPSAEPFRWSVSTLRVRDAKARLLTEAGPKDVGIAVEARELAGDGDHPAPTKLVLAMDAARIALEGGARIASPGFAGTLTVRDLPVPDAERLAGSLPPELLRGGILGADIELALGSAASPPGDLTATGTLRLTDFAMQGADPEEFSVAVAATDVALEELRLPGIVPSGDAPPPAPIQVRLASLTVTEPRLRLTRSEDGLVLPAFTRDGAAPPAEAPAPDAGDAASQAADAVPPPQTAGEEATAEPQATVGEAARAPAPLEVTVAALDVQRADLRVADRTVKPYFSGGLSPLDVDAQALRWPLLAVDRLRVEATSVTRGTLTATGRLAPDGGTIELRVKDLALQPFNPYATHYSPYSIARGALDVTTKATFGKGAYDAKTALALRKFDLGGKEGDSLFRQQFGIPIEVALALLRDIEGKISLDIPVEGDQRGARVSVMDLAAQALRKALVNALASPLKLVGAAFGGKEGATAPAPIAFEPGRAEPTDEGKSHLNALADLLASRPGIAITLSGAPTKSDARRLHEQALYDELAQPQGVLGAIGNLAQRGARERVRAALEERAEGKEGRLEPDDAAKLEEWLAERPKPTDENLRALVRARQEHMAKTLRDGRGIAAERVVLADPAAEVRDAPPTIEYEVGAAGLQVGAS